MEIQLQQAMELVDSYGNVVMSQDFATGWSGVRAETLVVHRRAELVQLRAAAASI